MDIARLSHDDAPAYRALMLEAYEANPDAFTSSAAERAALPLTWWESRLLAQDDAPEVVLGARDAHGLCGVVGIAFESREKTSHKATVFGMYVMPDHRKRGLGVGLVRAAIALARARTGVRILQLTVTQGNHAAQHLYERFGFQVFGTEPFAVRVADGFVRKVHMWLDLEAPVAVSTAKPN